MDRRLRRIYDQHEHPLDGIEALLKRAFGDFKEWDDELWNAWNIIDLFVEIAEDKILGKDISLWTN